MAAGSLFFKKVCSACFGSTYTKKQCANVPRAACFVFQNCEHYILVEKAAHHTSGDWTCEQSACLLFLKILALPENKEQRKQAWGRQKQSESSTYYELLQTPCFLFKHHKNLKLTFCRWGRGVARQVPKG